MLPWAFHDTFVSFFEQDDVRRIAFEFLFTQAVIVPPARVDGVEVLSALAELATDPITIPERSRPRPAFAAMAIFNVRCCIS